MPKTSAVRTSFVVGPEKTATTFMQLLLEQHPEVQLPRGIKETFFFDRFHDNGIEWYLKRFDLGGPAPHLIEVAPSYFCEEKAIARIARDFPDARIVICVRDVFRRTVSHYNHMRRYGYIDVPLSESLDPKRRPLRASLYSRYIPLWEEYFGSENVRVLDMAQLKDDPKKFAEEVFRAVGVPVIKLPSEVLDARANEAAEPRNLVVARLATKVSNRFKQWGLYRVLGVLRRLRLNHLVFGSRKVADNSKPDPETAAMLEEALQEERAFLAERFGITDTGSS